jgi:hypothetical protein
MRRMLLLAALAAFAFFAAPSGAETCTANGESQMTALTTGTWTGCTADSTDTFVLDTADDYIRVTASLTHATTGGFDCRAGTLHFMPGTTLTLTSAGIKISGTCRLIAIGQVVYQGRVSAEPTFAGATVTLPVDRTTTGVADTDFIVFGNDDPPNFDGDLTGRQVWVGPGVPSRPSIYRPSALRGKWVDINTAGVAAGSLQYLHQEAGITVGATAAPYAGTRGDLITSPLAPVSMTRQRYGFATRINVATGTIGGINGDLGSMYVAFEEVPAAASDPTECSGWKFKILHTVDGAAGEDLIYVAGDATPCTSGRIRLTHGDTRGDPIKVIRPVVFNGANVGSFFGNGGVYEMRYARLIQMASIDRTAPTPDVARNCAVCFYALDATSTFSGYLADLDIAWMNEAATVSGQTGGLFFTGAITGTDTSFRFNSAPLDLRNLRLERLYVHDTRDSLDCGAGTCEGVHSLDFDGTTGVVLVEPRMERGSDDGFVIISGALGTGIPITHDVRFPIIYEQIHGGAKDKSQDCVTIGGVAAGMNDAHDYVVFGRGLRIRDMVVMGCNQLDFVSAFMASRMERFVVGGQTQTGATFGNIASGGGSNPSVDCQAGTGVPVACCTGSQTGTCSLGDKAMGAYPVLWTDAFIAGYGHTTSTAPITLGGWCMGCLYFGQEQRGTNLFTQLVSKSIESFWDFGTSTASAMFGGNSSVSVDTHHVDEIAMIDTVAINASARPWNTWGDGSDTTATPSRAVVQRTVLELNNIATTGPFDIQIAGSADPVFTIDGLWCNQTAPSGNDALTVGAGSTARNVCFASAAATPTIAFPSPLVSTDPTLLLFSTLMAPDHTAEGTLRQFVRRRSERFTPCDNAYPEAIGLRRVGVGHAMLGDGFLSQISSFSSRDDLLTAVQDGGHELRVY